MRKFACLVLACGAATASLAQGALVVQPTEPATATAAPADPAATAAADETPALTILPAAEAVLDDFLWLNRVIVVFADTERDPAFRKQMELLQARPSDLLERDVVIIVDTDPAARTAIREELRPRGFGFVLIDKDGVIKLRKPSPWSTRELAHSIDKTPLRQDEIKERNRENPS